MAKRSVVVLRVVLLVVSAGRVPVQPALADDLGFLVDVDGILNEQLMPVSYLMLDGDPDGRDAGQVESRMENYSAGNGTKLDPVLDASYSRALSTMGFHRNMINLYRCNGYLAKRILAEAYPVGKSTAQLSKRMSSAHPNGNATLAAMMTDNSMLYDQGSAGYREWLTKTATLDDISQNYLSQRVAHGTTRVGEVAPGAPGEQELEFDEGVITGYAVQPAPVANNLYYPVPDHPYRREVLLGGGQRELLQGEAASGYGRPPGDRGDYYYAGHPPALEVDHKALRKPGGGSVGLKDLFDIALTTLAFLSFGMFILQVIMCITMTKPETGMMILPTQPIEVEVDEGEVRHRAARHLADQGDGGGIAGSAAGVQELNHLAAQALDSVDVMRTGDQRCLQWSLCTVNRFARTVKTIKFYWIPVWSLAVCWKAGDGQLTAVPSERPAPSNVIMSCLIATLAGLGNDNCRKLYRCPHPTNGGQ